MITPPIVIPVAVQPTAGVATGSSGDLSTHARENGPRFDSAMKAAAKPARKASASKQPESALTGETLPGGGNLPPPAQWVTPVLAATGAAAVGAQAGSGAATLAPLGPAAVQPPDPVPSAPLPSDLPPTPANPAAFSVAAATAVDAKVAATSAPSPVTVPKAGLKTGAGSAAAARVAAAPADTGDGDTAVARASDTTGTATTTVAGRIGVTSDIAAVSLPTVPDPAPVPAPAPAASSGDANEPGALRHLVNASAVAAVAPAAAADSPQADALAAVAPPGAAMVPSANSRTGSMATADEVKHLHGAAGATAMGGADDVQGAAEAALASTGTPELLRAVDAAPMATIPIHANVDSAEFAQGLSDRVSWMVANGINGAKLQVNPPQLGPIELRIAVQGDHAQVWMTTHSTLAREALESGAPALKEMLGAQGFGQVSVDISQRSFQDRPAYTPPYVREAAVSRSVASVAPTTAKSRPRGALDAYA